ncbi:hypothetical protein [Streptomyces sp. UNOC14_S4]|uniref:hypothetical protein n=1 Tax=Streptomyces sp. UNOC14_S4 TaxID=2872340 RepID=UPI001E4FAC1F|nr:hypothetical protein [Streptomyces sp. UNOC14_S4]MCC3769852.1 hypothetical protein [Streptomyces sp. UNOC14_S4]
MATVALPGVALCGGGALSDILASSASLLASLAVAVHLTAKSKPKASETHTALTAVQA